jgi:hypothetical protein
VINRLQEALEGTRDRESHLAERLAASVADGHRSPHAFLHSFYGASREEAAKIGGMDRCGIG